ncbi:hypothetical protein BKA63DRAFT_520704 [Paraphoma chrysanthemicola]|nr:hypothetical protein BKA63DRAFT_520704 [Paraphoma chrysanthemicola]
MSVDRRCSTQPCELVDSQSFTSLDPTTSQCPHSGIIDTFDALDASFAPYDFLTSWCTCDNPYSVFCSEHGFENRVHSSMDHLGLDPFKLDFSSSRTDHADRVDTAGPMSDQQTTDGSFEYLGWPDTSEPERPTIGEAIGVQTRPRRSGRHGSRAHRSNISIEAKSILQTHFARDPYPSIEELDLLAQNTSLSLQTVRTWFNNVRSRDRTSDSTQNGSSEQSAIIEKASLISKRSVSESSLELLNRLSPKSSNSSLERFLNAPAEEESVSISAVESASLEPYVPANRLGSSMYTQPTYRDTSSVVGSESSFSSANSVQSWNSQISADSRGARRGRKRWRRAQSSLVERKKGQNITKPKTNDVVTLPARAAHINDSDSFQSPNRAYVAPTPLLHAETASSQKLFCTWPTCETTFQSRFDWDRHETAVHHFPFKWVCNLSEYRGNQELSWCHSCKRARPALHRRSCDCGRSETPSRTFFRKDQLGQHMKRIHFGQDKLSTDTFSDTLLACKIENPSKSASLHCGFCGMSFLTWKTRQDHVFTHMRNGACKSSWWPERLGERFEARADSFTCPACGFCFETFSDAVREHPYCFTWSCRYLHNASESITATGGSIDGLYVVNTKCRLCPEHFSTTKMGLEEASQRVVEHIDGHIRGCSQEIFTNQYTFAAHLQSEHGAGLVVAEDEHLKQWQRIQFLEIIEGRGMIRTSRPYANVDCCGSKETGYSFTFVDL